MLGLMHFMLDKLMDSRRLFSYPYSEARRSSLTHAEIWAKPHKATLKCLSMSEDKTSVDVVIIHK